MVPISREDPHRHDISRLGSPPGRGGRLAAWCDARVRDHGGGEARCGRQAHRCVGAEALPPEGQQELGELCVVMVFIAHALRTCDETSIVWTFSNPGPGKGSGAQRRRLGLSPTLHSRIHHASRHHISGYHALKQAFGAP